MCLGLAVLFRTVVTQNDGDYFDTASEIIDFLIGIVFLIIVALYLFLSFMWLSGSTFSLCGGFNRRLLTWLRDRGG